MEISGNAVLKDLDGISNLDTIDGKLKISDNEALENIDGLSNINSLEGYLMINNNPVLTDLFGLGNLNSLKFYYDAYMGQTIWLVSITDNIWLPTSYAYDLVDQLILFDGEVEISGNLD